MNNKYNLKKNIYYAVFSFIINIALVFVNYKVVIYYLGIETLGLWSLLMAWANVIRFGDVGMGNATLHFLSKLNINTDGAKIQKIIDTGLILNIVIFFLLTVSGYFILSYNLENIIDDKNYLILAKNILPILFISVFFATVSSIVFGNLMGLHYGYMSSYLTVSGNIIQIILVVILVPKIGLVGLVWAQLIQYLLILIIGVYVVKTKVKSESYLPVNFSFNTLKVMLNYSLKTQFANTLNGIFEPFSKIILSRYGDLTAQGIYEIAYKTASLSRNIVISGLSASLPFFTDIVNNDNSKSYDLYKKSKNNLMKGLSLIMLIVIISTPLISFLWLGEIIKNYIIYVILIYIGLFFNTYGETAYKFGQAVGKLKNNILSRLFALLSLIIFSFFLGNVYQDIGIIIAVMLGLATGGITINYLNEKLLFKKTFCKQKRIL